MKAVFLFLCLLLVACDSDGLQWSPNSEQPPVQLEVGFYKSFYGVGEFLRSDTIQPGDSIFLTANIQPSRSIRMKKYHWKIDSVQKEQVFNLRTSFQTAGLHTASFHLVDYYGDTLSDTVRIWVSHPPQWGNNMSPSDSSWGIPALRTGIAFHWEVNDPDPGDAIYSTFSLFQEDSLLLDTTVTGTSLAYNRPLSPLTLYRWKVSVHDSYGMTPENNAMQNVFVTGGFGNEAGVQAPALRRDFPAEPLQAVLSCRNTQTQTVYTASPEQDKLVSFPAGNYLCWASSLRYTDLQTDSVPAQLYPGQLRLLTELVLRDTIAPTITAPDSSSPLPGGIPLTFSITDSGPGLWSASVWWNGVAMDAWSRNGPELTVSPPTAQISSDPDLLTIKLEDRSGNVSWHAWQVATP